MITAPLIGQDSMVYTNQGIATHGTGIYPTPQVSNHLHITNSSRVYQPWLTENKYFAPGQDSLSLPRSTTTSLLPRTACLNERPGEIYPSPIQPDNYTSPFFPRQQYLPNHQRLSYQPSANPTAIPDVALSCLNGGLYGGSCNILSSHLEAQQHFYLPTSVGFPSSNLVHRMFPSAHRLPANSSSTQYDPLINGFTSNSSVQQAAFLAVRDHFPSSTITRRCARCRCPNCLSPNPVKNSNGKKEHICHFPNCRKVYGKTSHLKAHIRWHLGERPFVCHWMFCGKSFTRSDELQRHLRTHTGEKKFKCPICEKRFMRSDHLSKHVKIHQKKESKPKEEDKSTKN